MVLKPLFTEVTANEVDELVLHCHTEVPDLIVGNVVDLFPVLHVALVLEEFRTESLFIQSLPF